MNHLQSLKTLSYVNIRRILRIWIQTIIPPAITTALYFLIFGELIGKRIGEMPGYEGLTYLEFMVPGLIMLSVITNSYANVASAFFGSKFQKAIEEILISPMPNWAIMFGFIIGGITRGILVGIVVVLVSLLFTSFQINNIALTLFSIVITSTLFSILGLINGIYAKTFDDISIIPANAIKKAENHIHLIKKLICILTIQLPSSSWSPIVRYTSFIGVTCIAVSVVIWPLVKYLLFSGLKLKLLPFLSSM